MSMRRWPASRRPGSRCSLPAPACSAARRPHALWVGVERSPELVRLRDKIEQALIRAGLEPEQRKFAPHVTLARLRDPELDKLGHFLAANAQFRADPLPVDHFSLIASFPTKAGSVYEDQADYPLSGFWDPGTRQRRSALCSEGMPRWPHWLA